MYIILCTSVYIYIYIHCKETIAAERNPKAFLAFSLSPRPFKTCYNHQFGPILIFIIYIHMVFLQKSQIQVYKINSYRLLHLESGSIRSRGGFWACHHELLPLLLRLTTADHIKHFRDFFSCCQVLLYLCLFLVYFKFIKTFCYLHINRICLKNFLQPKIILYLFLPKVKPSFFLIK